MTHDMRYIEIINQLIQDEIRHLHNIVLFGQNISTGSCLGGLTKKLNVTESSRVINSTNAENSLVGIGMGLMMSGISSVFFVKQLDFVLLAMDQIVNTNNFARLTPPTASFTIMPIVVDSGYQGIQSSYNGFGDICALAQIPGFLINSSADAKTIISEEMFRPGLKMIGVSQRLFNIEFSESVTIQKAGKNNDVFEYASGKDITIVCFNLSLTYGLEIQKAVERRDRTASVYTVNYVDPVDWSMIEENIRSTRRLIIVDDSKTIKGFWRELVARISQVDGLKYLETIRREPLEETLKPYEDKLVIDADIIVEQALGV